LKAAALRGGAVEALRYIAHMFVGRWSFGLVVVAVGLSPRVLYAQFTDPRTYTVSPVGLNEFETSYTRAHANGSLDTSLAIGGAHVDLNEGAVAYTHYSGLLGHLAWATTTLPLARLSGYVSGTSFSRTTSGAGDASLDLSMLLGTGHTLSAAELSKYVPVTTWGLSVTVTAPTGKYDADRLVNLGSNRWSFKPEVGVSHPFGPEQTWEIDGYLNVTFFSDNRSYQGIEVLRQEPLPGLETHLSHDFTPHFWMSLDVRYAFLGDTFVNGTDQDSPQQMLTLGSEASWSPSDSQSIEFVFASAVVHKNAPAATGVSIRYTYSWGAD
jgi:Putative MetA-pathway of phenol degradation